MLFVGFDIKKKVTSFHHQQIYILQYDLTGYERKPIEVQRITLKKPPV